MQNIFTLKNFLSTITHRDIVIITDHQVKKHFALNLQKQLSALDYRVLLLSIPPGEKSKSQKTTTKLQNQMFHHKLGRDTLLLAVGGGVVGDLAGFIAATYMRGIDYIQVPTTLLAMVDSSIGGKTGINTDYGKNLVGAFYQPLAIWVDMDRLKTLPKIHLANGLLEVAKIFITCDANAFQYLSKNISAALNGNLTVLKKLIKRAIALKKLIVNKDMNDKNYRSILNFGHTLGHAIEHAANYKILHGFAVGLGIILESRLAHTLGYLRLQDLQRIENLMVQLGATVPSLREGTQHGNPTPSLRGAKRRGNPSINKILSALKHDKKIQHQQNHYILIKKIGTVVTKNSSITHPIPTLAIKQILEKYYARK